MLSSLSLSAPANDPSYRASDPAVLASRLNWHHPVQPYPVAGHMASATNHDLIQLPMADNASLRTYEHVRHLTNSSPDPI